MSNNTITLTTEIKRTLRSVNYPFLILGSLFISFLGWLMVLGHNPDLIDSSFESHLGFTLTMTIILIALLIGIAIGMGITQFYKPRVLRYVNAPNDIETIRDGLIALGSFVTTIENTINSKPIARIFRYINQQLNKIPLIQSDVKKLKHRITQLEATDIDKSKKITSLESQVESLKEKQAENDQLMSDKTLTQNTSENTKPVKKSNKLDFSIE